MKDEPLVSIIINNFNYESFLAEAINSALNQTYLHREVIVVDDGSTDNSRQIIISYGDRITPVFKENGGQASAFNAGFAVSQGDIICFLDSDDVFLPEKAAEIVDIFTKHPDIGWCFHSLNLVDKRSEELVGVSREKISRKCNFITQIKHGKLPFYPPPTSGLCFQRSLIKLILPMTESLRRGADRYLVTIAVALSQGFFLDNKLAVQGIHEDNGNTLKMGKIFATRRAYKHIVVAYFMQLKLPESIKYTNKIFAKGLSIYLKNRVIKHEGIEYAKYYLSKASWLNKIKISMMIFYYLFSFSNMISPVQEKQEKKEKVPTL